jgi:chromosome segregation ATPase
VGKYYDPWSGRFVDEPKVEDPCTESEEEMEQLTRDDMHFDMYPIDQRYDELLADYSDLEADMEAKYEEEIDAMNSEILELEDALWEAKNTAVEVEELEAENGDLREEITKLEGDLIAAEDRIADLEYEADRRENSQHYGRSRR